jgi:hypothetical protein
MKLNNHGWGVRDFVIYLSILILLLFFVAFSISNFYRRLEKDRQNRQNNQQYVDQYHPTEITDDDIDVTPQNNGPKIVNYDYYHTLEEDFRNATNKYLLENPTEISNRILVLTDTDLVGLGYMYKMHDEEYEHTCTGYSTTYLLDDTMNYQINVYINCGEYITEGY